MVRKEPGFHILRELGTNTEGVIFMEDDHGNVIEIACVPELPTLNFKSLNPLLIHSAVECENPSEEAKRLVEAGAR